MSWEVKIRHFPLTLLVVLTTVQRFMFSAIHDMQHLLLPSVDICRSVVPVSRILLIIWFRLRKRHPFCGNSI